MFVMRNRHTIYIMLLVLLVVISTFCCLYRQAGLKRVTPVVAASKRHRDLGVVLPGSEIRAEFAISNEGDAPLEIGNIKTSCGCTSAQAIPERLPPGSSGIVQVVFRAPNRMDPVAHNIVVATNDPERKHVLFSFTAHPVWPAIASPLAIDFGVVKVGERVSKELEVYSPRNTPFVVRNISSNVDGVSAEEVRRSPVRYLWNVFFLPQAAGSVKGELLILTDIPGNYTMRIPLASTVTLEPTVSPEHLLLGSQQAGTEIAAAISVTDANDCAFVSARIKSSEWSVVHFSVRTEQSGSKRVHVIVRIPDAVGFRRSKLEIKAVPDCRTLTIPVSCYVVKGM